MGTASSRRMRILLVTGRFFVPMNTGGRIRSAETFRRLARAHELTIVSLATGHETTHHVELLKSMCHRLVTVPWHEPEKGSASFWKQVIAAAFTNLPFSVYKYRNAQLQTALRETIESWRPDLLICDFLQPSINCFPIGFRPQILFQHNVEAQIRERQVARESGIRRRLLMLDLARLRAFEGRAGRHFDHCIMVSDEDAHAMQIRYGIRSVSAVPTGVDTEFFAPLGLERERAELVFTGSMDWFPNEDAVVFFCKDVLPKLRTPGVTFTIVGRNPSARVRHLAGTEPGVRVTGTVEDVRPFIDRAAVYVVPLRIGGGTRIKIFEAMAMAKPIVSTSLGAEGLPVTDNTHLLLADDPLAFAQSVDRLLEDPASATALGTRARLVAVESWSWDAAASAFEDICDQVVERYKRRHES